MQRKERPLIPTRKEMLHKESPIVGLREAESEIAPTSDPKEAVCFYSNTKGHWKRSCQKYLKDLKDGKVEKGGHSGMFMIELHNTTTSDSWVLDTGCGTHICTVLQGLKESRRLKHRELNLVIGNKKIMPVTRIGKYKLMLKFGVRMYLNNCCYSSEMIRNIISFHALFKDGYKFSFDNEHGDVLVYSNGCFMFKASPCKGIYETVECISNNGNVILNVGSSNRLDKSKLWHFLLGHMTKSLFTGTCKRGERLLDLVHTDVCGPFRSATKDGKRYYVTFTDDFSRYGYVYLIKHKSDTFEVFKRYQNEVENQLGKKDKVSQLTPPRTPQLNGVVERRNRTILDMVRSMMCRATLPISFWEDSGSKIDLEEIQESADEEPIVNTDTQQEVVTPVEPEDISLSIRRTSSRVSKPPQFYYSFHIEEDKISDSTLSELDEPANYKEAMASPEAAKWKEAMKSEIQSMYDNQVWNLVDTTPGLKTVGCKWIFKKKTNMDGKVHTYKARLVAKGYTQTHGIDYEETFSPVAKIKSIRIMLAVAAFHDYEIWKMDVNTAFLNEKLTEDVFMAQPEGFENAKYPKRVCKLQKAIYGLKHASLSGSVVVFLVLYVDDILLIGNDIPTLQSVKDWLRKCFAMKDLGDATYILGIKIYRDRSKRLIGLSQDTYLDKILKRFKMENSKKGNLPLHHGIKISKDLCPKTDEELDKMSRVPYASAIISIMYAMTCTRPDVSFVLSMVSRHQQNPGEGYWTAVKNIFKYLRNTKDRFLVYGGEEELRVTGYCDASWQTYKDDSRSQSGWVFLLNGGAVTWKSSKKDTVADSTCESEYIAACEASKSAVALTKKPKDHGKSKHIERKYHFIRSKVEEGHAIVKDIQSEDNPADPFTKALDKSRHDEHARSIGLKDKINFSC
ncbi:retrotransposon protein, putative, ty1-copia subclass [Tanacetum coccineum]